MKGISAVIATILMLVIIITLAGMAYGYIMGIFRVGGRVMLSVMDSECGSGGVWVVVKNGGTANTTDVTVTWVDRPVPSTAYLQARSEVAQRGLAVWPQAITLSEFIRQREVRPDSYTAHFPG